ncbi:MAG: hypothetical protein DMF03_03960 [Verrucomicrobia bacterium]|nr:MAG: hypothetical protein DMF03_03960 [Verrucomicrobiota bacterium]
MIKTTLALLAAGAFSTSAFAGDAPCCAGKASADAKANCMTFASLNITADQKAKLETWQAECMKGGCTKQSRAAFMEKAKTILSPDQYAELKSKCDKGSRQTQS